MPPARGGGGFFDGIGMKPKQICKHCGRERNCENHLRADFPPDAAKKWLKKTCKEAGKPCAIEYRAGLESVSYYTGM